MQVAKPSVFITWHCRPRNRALNSSRGRAGSRRAVAACSVRGQCIYLTGLVGSSALEYGNWLLRELPSSSHAVEGGLLPLGPLNGSIPFFCIRQKRRDLCGHHEQKILNHRAAAP